MALHDDRKPLIREAARRAGFDRCSFAPIVPPPHGEFLRRWVDDGHAAGMGYLGKGFDKRLDPTLILESARSVVSLAVRYQAPPLPPIDWQQRLRGRIAAYALGTDYHADVEAKLDVLMANLRTADAGLELKRSVDVGAVMEREWAWLAGSGWFGKNTNILHTVDGSYFFLAELITNLDFSKDELVPDHCGTCVRCLDLCPTGALKPGYLLDARLCISYWTIEHRGSIPPEMRSKLGNWIFGCDVCQEVCPWNEKLVRIFGAPEADALLPFLPSMLRLTPEEFHRRYRRTPLWRIKRDGFVRNVAVALGNSGNPSAIPFLQESLTYDSSALVREHVAWALGRIGGSTAYRTLLVARRREFEDSVVREIDSALSQCAVG